MAGGNLIQQTDFDQTATRFLCCSRTTKDVNGGAVLPYCPLQSVVSASVAYWGSHLKAGFALCLRTHKTTAQTRTAGKRFSRYMWLLVRVNHIADICST